MRCPTYAPPYLILDPITTCRSPLRVEPNLRPDNPGEGAGTECFAVVGSD